MALESVTEREIRVVLADGHALIRAALRALLEREGGIAVVAEASDGLEAVAAARRTAPDVVLIDVGVPGLDAVEATREIVGLSGGEARVLLLTTSEHDAEIIDGLRSGASGFLVKEADPAELLRAVRVVAAGDAVLSPSVTRRLIAELAAWPRPRRWDAAELDELTPREREVLALVASGLSNAEIAEALVVSPATAKTHVSRTMLKLRAHDRAQLVVLAYQTGLVQPAGSRTPLQEIAA